MALGRISSILLGSKLRLVAVALGLLVAVGAAGAASGVLGAPSVAGVENRFGDVNETTTTIESDLTVRNPNPVGVQLGGMTVDYAVGMNGITMATGTKSGVGVDSGNSTLNFTSHLRNDRIPDWWVSHLQNGEHTTLTVDADVHSSLVGRSVGAPAVERQIETDVSSSFNSTETRPINASQPVVSDPVLYLNETSGHWGEVTDAETPVEMTFTVYNPKPYPVSASSIGYDVTMNDVAVGTGSSERELVIPPGETRTIEATTVIDNEHLDEWWVTHLERNQVTDLEIQFYARFDLSALGGGSVRVPLDSVDHTIETDVFGTKNETAGSPDDGSGDGSGAGAGSGDGDASTETGAATDAETTTETTDDDGLLGDDGTEVTESSSAETETPTDATTDDGGAGSTETATDDDGILL